MMYLTVGTSILISAAVGAGVTWMRIRRWEKRKYDLLTGLYRFISERDKDDIYYGY